MMLRICVLVPLLSPVFCHGFDQPKHAAKEQLKPLSNRAMVEVEVDPAGHLDLGDARVQHVMNRSAHSRHVRSVSKHMQRREVQGATLPQLFARHEGFQDPLQTAKMHMPDPVDPAADQNPVHAAEHNQVVQAVNDDVAIAAMSHYADGHGTDYSQSVAHPHMSIPGVSATTAMPAGAKGSTNASGVPGEEDEGRDVGYLTWMYHRPVYMTIVLLLALLVTTCSLDARNAAAKDDKSGDKSVQTVVKKEPYTWAARFPGLVLMVVFALYSLPFTGYILSGCFWNSLAGISVAISLAGACLAPWLKLLDIPGTSKIQGLKITNYQAAMALISAAPGGVVLAMFEGDDTCAPLFFRASILLVPVPVCFGLGYLAKEEAGLSGLFRPALI